MQTYDWYADGKWLEPAGGGYFDGDNPCTGKPRAQIVRGNEITAGIAVQAADRAFREAFRGRLAPSERGKTLRRISDAVVRHVDAPFQAPIDD